MRLRAGKMLIVAGAIAILGLAPGRARASFLVQVTATLNAPTNGSVTTNQSTAALSSFTGGPADLDLATAGAPVHETFGTTLVSSGNSTGADSIAFNYSWTLTFTHLVDGQAVGASATATVTGSIAGLVSQFGSTLQNTYTGLKSNLPSLNSMTPPSIIVDGRPILVQLDAWTPPGTPPAASPDFSVSLKYNPNGSFPIPAGGGDGGGGTTAVPEPSTIALLGLGAAAMLAPALRRRARRSPAQADAN